MAYLNLLSNVKEHVATAVNELLVSEFQIEAVDTATFKFEIPPDEKMGHLAFACFPLARVARKAPQQIAGKLAESWKDDALFAKVEAVGPYLNFFYSPNWLAQEIFPVATQSEEYGNSNLGNQEKILLEYSSPNTNKPLHLGHGRNNLLGITLSRLFETCGYEVIKANLVNDRGIHICKSMLAYQKWGEGKTPESVGKKGDQFVGDYYVLFAQKEKEHPELNEEAQAMLRDWEAGDEKVRELWELMNGWVLEGFRETYDRMGVSFNKYYYESETFYGGKELVVKALEDGICYKEENGAIAIDLEQEKLGKKILLRSDGTSVYMTQDINTTVCKFKDFDPKKCMFVVGNEQDNHFKVLFKVLEKFGFDWAKECEHISYGMITLPEGKMKSREGTVVDLDMLMDDMKLLAAEQMQERQGEHLADRPAEEIDQTAEAIGLAAIKYYILRTNATRTISFNPKESLSFDGATGPYLQYSHARMNSVLQRADYDEAGYFNEAYDWNPAETSLLAKLSAFPQAIENSCKEKNPAELAGYVYDLCRVFNKFYYDNQILKAENETTVQARLSLVRATKAVVKKSLEIFGIVPLERM